MLLGRDLERQTLDGLLGEARGGRSAVLALVGEAGIGKSTLLDWVASSADSFLVLRARGIQSEAHVPFAGLFELLRPALDRLDAIPAPQAAALESALALRPGKAENRFAVGAATLSLLAAKAEAGPLVVLVDDVHWLDGSSADAILFAVRRLLADPIAVVLSAREGEPSLLDGADLPTLRLEGLAAEPATELLRREQPDIGAGALERLLRETGRNPLALVELVRERPPELALDAPPPVVTSVAAAYLQRAETLPARTARALVLAAATDRGEVALFTRAAAALDLETADLEPAEGAKLLELRDGRLEFCHPLARSAIYGGAEADLRRTAHRALADALPDSDADRRAWHLALAALGPDEAASSALDQAAARARERSAYEVASSAFERAALLAVDDVRRGSLLFAAADTAWLGGQADRALSLLDEAERVADSHRIAQLRGEIVLRRGPLHEGRVALVAAAERASVANPDDAVAMLAEAAFGAFFEADAAALRYCGERAAELAARSTNERTTFFAQLTEGMALVFGGEGERGAAAIREGMATIQRLEQLDDARLLVWAALGPLWLREADTGRELSDRAAAAARAESAVGVLPHLLVHVSLAHVSSDRWAEAQAGFDEAVRLARETGQRIVLAAALARFAGLEARLGHEDSCRAQLAEALAISRELDVALAEIWSLLALGELELVLGNVAEAVAALEEEQAVVARCGVDDVDLDPAPELVELQLRLGRPEQAAALAASYSASAAFKGQPWALARAARTRGLVADDDAFEACFVEALELHERTPDVFEQARTLLAYGERLRRAARRTAARERLRAGLAIFEELGAAAWSERARTELAASGETARRREAATLDELTPQEVQISLLLAEGKTTREAAAALFLSPKTIEYHLRNAYRKLAIHSRDELREAMRAQTS